MPQRTGCIYQSIEIRKYHPSAQAYRTRVAVFDLPTPGNDVEHDDQCTYDDERNVSHLAMTEDLMSMCWDDFGELPNYGTTLRLLCVYVSIGDMNGEITYC